MNSNFHLGGISSDIQLPYGDPLAQSLRVITDHVLDDKHLQGEI